MNLRGLRAVLLVPAAALLSCEPSTAPSRTMRPQTFVLIATPKMIADFANPDSSVGAFLAHYAPLTARATETIVVFAVGNSEHILTYPGAGYPDRGVEWARMTDGVVVSDRVLTYAQIDGIVRSFRREAIAADVNLKVYDQVDSGIEFTYEFFKLNHHPECFSQFWGSFDIRGQLTADTVRYATAPTGTVPGTLCGTFLADQVAAYVRDLGLDGILYGNQLGTRGQWQPTGGPGYSSAEAAAIRAFFQYSKAALGTHQLMWFDSYNNTDIERTRYSVPGDAYAFLDYIIASGFCVITFPQRYRDDLQSKLRLTNRQRVLATLDYVDPWYTYNSMTAFPDKSATLEVIAIEHRYDVDGFVLFAHDEKGAPVPSGIVSSFAKRYFKDN